ncbi:1,2-dihydroxy-3-keto-5-methylthiopentene dioxygenase [Savitreella phatthalungensis]
MGVGHGGNEGPQSLSNRNGLSWNLPAVMQFIQSEHARYERDRNNWELERAELRAQLVKLEGERKSFERLKAWYYRRLKMVEHVLKNPGNPWPRESTDLEDKASSQPGFGAEQPATSPGAGRSSSVVLDDRLPEPPVRVSGIERRKSRIFLERCLAEVTYLTSGRDSVRSPNLPLQFRDGKNVADSNGPSLSKDPDMINAATKDVAEPGCTAEAVTTSGSAATVEAIQDDMLSGQLGDTNALVATDIGDPPDFTVDTGRTTGTSSHGQSRRRSSTPSQASKLFSTLQNGRSVASECVNDMLCIAVAQAGGSIDLYHLPSDDPPLSLQAHSAEVDALSLVMSNDRGGDYKLKLYSGGHDHMVYEWDCALQALKARDTIEPVRSFGYHATAVISLNCSDSKLVSASEDGVICVWDLAEHNSKPQEVLRAGTSSGARLACVSVSWRQNRIAAGFEDGTLVVLNLHTGETLSNKELGIGSLICLYSLSDDCILAGTRSGHIAQLNISSVELKSDIIAKVEADIRCIVSTQPDKQESAIVATSGGALYEVHIGTGNTRQLRLPVQSGVDGLENNEHIHDIAYIPSMRGFEDDAGWSGVPVILCAGIGAPHKLLHDQPLAVLDA